jgi:hypothetical protein
VVAIIGCDDGRGMVWPDDVPAEVARQGDSRDGPSARKDSPKALQPLEGVSAAPKAKRTRKRPVLGAVADVEAREATGGNAARSGQGTAPSRPAVAPAPPLRAAGPSSPTTRAPSRKKRELPPYLRVVK